MASARRYIVPVVDGTGPEVVGVETGGRPVIVGGDAAVRHGGDSPLLVVARRPASRQSVWSYLSCQPPQV
jgi:hypothetical protein